MGTWRGGREGAKLVARSLIVLFTALGATPAMARPVLILDLDAARRPVTLAPEKPPAASQFFRMTVSGSGLSPYSATLGGR